MAMSAGRSSSAASSRKAMIGNPDVVDFIDLTSYDHEEDVADDYSSYGFLTTPLSPTTSMNSYRTTGGGSRVGDRDDDGATTYSERLTNIQETSEVVTEGRDFDDSAAAVDFQVRDDTEVRRNGERIVYSAEEEPHGGGGEQQRTAASTSARSDEEREGPLIGFAARLAERRAARARLEYWNARTRGSSSEFASDLALRIQDEVSIVDEIADKNPALENVESTQSRLEDVLALGEIRSEPSESEPITITPSLETDYMMADESVRRQQESTAPNRKDDLSNRQARGESAVAPNSSKSVVAAVERRVETGSVSSTDATRPLARPSHVDAYKDSDGGVVMPKSSGLTSMEPPPHQLQPRRPPSRTINIAPDIEPEFTRSRSRQFDNASVSTSDATGPMPSRHSKPIRITSSFESDYIDSELRRLNTSQSAADEEARHQSKRYKTKTINIAPDIEPEFARTRSKQFDTVSVSTADATRPESRSSKTGKKSSTGQGDYLVTGSDSFHDAAISGRPPSGLAAQRFDAEAIKDTPYLEQARHYHDGLSISTADATGPETRRAEPIEITPSFETDYARASEARQVDASSVDASSVDTAAQDHIKITPSLETDYAKANASGSASTADATGPSYREPEPISITPSIETEYATSPVRQAPGDQHGRDDSARRSSRQNQDGSRGPIQITDSLETEFLKPSPLPSSSTSSSGVVPVVRAIQPLESEDRRQVSELWDRGTTDLGPGLANLALPGTPTHETITITHSIETECQKVASSNSGASDRIPQPGSADRRLSDQADVYSLQEAPRSRTVSFEEPRHSTQGYSSETPLTTIIDMDYLRRVPSDSSLASASTADAARAPKIKATSRGYAESFSVASMTKQHLDEPDESSDNAPEYRRASELSEINRTQTPSIANNRTILDGNSRPQDRISPERVSTRTSAIDEPITITPSLETRFLDVGDVATTPSLKENESPTINLISPNETPRAGAAFPEAGLLASAGGAAVGYSGSRNEEPIVLPNPHEGKSAASSPREDERESTASFAGEPNRGDTASHHEPIAATKSVERDFEHATMQSPNSADSRFSKSDIAGSIDRTTNRIKEGGSSLPPRVPTPLRDRQTAKPIGFEEKHAIHVVADIHTDLAADTKALRTTGRTVSPKPIPATPSLETELIERETDIGDPASFQVTRGAGASSPKPIQITPSIETSYEEHGSQQLAGSTLSVHERTHVADSGDRSEENKTYPLSGPRGSSLAPTFDRTRSANNEGSSAGLELESTMKTSQWSDPKNYAHGLLPQPLYSALDHSANENNEKDFESANIERGSLPTPRTPATEFDKHHRDFSEGRMLGNPGSSLLEPIAVASSAEADEPLGASLDAAFFTSARRYRVVGDATDDSYVETTTASRGWHDASADTSLGAATLTLAPGSLASDQEPIAITSSVEYDYEETPGGAGLETINVLDDYDPSYVIKERQLQVPDSDMESGATDEEPHTSVGTTPSLEKEYLNIEARKVAAASFLSAGMGVSEILKRKLLSQVPTAVDDSDVGVQSDEETRVQSIAKDGHILTRHIIQSPDAVSESRPGGGFVQSERLSSLEEADQFCDEVATDADTAASSSIPQNAVADNRPPLISKYLNPQATDAEAGYSDDSEAREASREVWNKITDMERKLAAASIRSELLAVADLTDGTTGEREPPSQAQDVPAKSAMAREESKLSSGWSSDMDLPPSAATSDDAVDVEMGHPHQSMYRRALARRLKNKNHMLRAGLVRPSPESVEGRQNTNEEDLGHERGELLRPPQGQRNESDFPSLAETSQPTAESRDSPDFTGRRAFAQQEGDAKLHASNEDTIVSQMPTDLAMSEIEEASAQTDSLRIQAETATLDTERTEPSSFQMALKERYRRLVENLSPEDLEDAVVKRTSKSETRKHPQEAREASLPPSDAGSNGETRPNDSLKVSHDGVQVTTVSSQETSVVIAVESETGAVETTDSDVSLRKEDPPPLDNRTEAEDSSPKQSRTLESIFRDRIANAQLEKRPPSEMSKELILKKASGLIKSRAAAATTTTDASKLGMGTPNRAFLEPLVDRELSFDDLDSESMPAHSTDLLEAEAEARTSPRMDITEFKSIVMSNLESMTNEVKANDNSGGGIGDNEESKGDQGYKISLAISDNESTTSSATEGKKKRKKKVEFAEDAEVWDGESYGEAVPRKKKYAEGILMSKEGNPSPKTKAGCAAAMPWTRELDSNAKHPTPATVRVPYESTDEVTSEEEGYRGIARYYNGDSTDEKSGFTSEENGGETISIVNSSSESILDPDLDPHSLYDSDAMHFVSQILDRSCGWLEEDNCACSYQSPSLLREIKKKSKAGVTQSEEKHPTNVSSRLSGKAPSIVRNAARQANASPLVQRLQVATSRKARQAKEKAASEKAKPASPVSVFARPRGGKVAPSPLDITNTEALTVSQPVDRIPSPKRKSKDEQSDRSSKSSGRRSRSSSRRSGSECPRKRSSPRHDEQVPQSPPLSPRKSKHEQQQNLSPTTRMPRKKSSSSRSRSLSPKKKSSSKVEDPVGQTRSFSPRKKNSLSKSGEKSRSSRKKNKSDDQSSQSRSMSSRKRGNRKDESSSLRSRSSSPRRSLFTPKETTYHFAPPQPFPSVLSPQTSLELSLSPNSIDMRSSSKYSNSAAENLSHLMSPHFMVGPPQPMSPHIGLTPPQLLSPHPVDGELPSPFQKRLQERLAFVRNSSTITAGDQKQESPLSSPVESRDDTENEFDRRMDEAFRSKSLESDDIDDRSLFSSERSAKSNHSGSGGPESVARSRVVKPLIPSTSSATTHSGGSRVVDYMETIEEATLEDTIGSGNIDGGPTSSFENWGAGGQTGGGDPSKHADKWVAGHMDSLGQWTGRRKDPFSNINEGGSGDTATVKSDTYALKKDPFAGLSAQERMAALELAEKLKRRAATLKRRRKARERREQEVAAGGYSSGDTAEQPNLTRRIKSY